MGIYITFDGRSGAGKGALVEWVRSHFESAGMSVVVLRDNQIDPLRIHGRKMTTWCERHGINPNSFMLSLFAAGYAISDQVARRSIAEHDVVLRDRSFISSLGYVPAAGVFTQEQIWELYVDHLQMRIPDAAIIVDADDDVAEERMQKRQQKDIGLGGKMSGDAAYRRVIRKNFLAVPRGFMGRLNAIVVSNNGRHTSDPDSLKCSLDSVGDHVIEFLKSTGVWS